MNPPDGPLRLLMSAEAAGKLSPDIARVLGGRAHVTLSPDHPDAALAQAAFVSRDVTGLSTKHRVLPPTQRMYDALRAAAGLRWVHIHSAGADRPVFVELRERGVQVTTSSGANAPVVAQTAVLGLLMLARHWPRLLAAQRERRWAPLIESGLPRDLQGQTAIVVGWGPVGREIGRLLRALGLRVVAVRREAGSSADEDVRFVGVGQWRELLPQADWLVLACPLTPQTRGLVGAAELALLPPHGGIVNVARGEVVDEPALIAALQAQRLAGAYLDVFATEPLSPDSPLWDLPNVIVTPHSAGFSDGNEARVARMFLDNLGRWHRGEALANRVGG
ncbi:D-2-hydroxyacid dehydrogenase [Ramlibacter tataouinensis]|uniref:D-2-hydroxyacid dehydrogenase n=1 Tax=Ramlibacter tataouinensis TaxID=94132 RepID=UPI001D0557D8|nr:D-2-hydroxyacid dehydrogenase [Ramlibacter tataouinensis]